MRTVTSRPGAVLGLVMLAGAVTVLPASATGAPSAAAGGREASSPGPPATIEALADYEAQSLCTPAAKRGTSRLARLVARKFGGGNISIPRGCDVGGTSEHKEGRALDWMVSRRVPAQRRHAEAFLEWLLAPDAAGNSAARARRLGVMYIGWDNRIWRAYDEGSWGELHGCLSHPKMRAAAYDSTCHRNHVHVSLSWDGATARTSYWTGRVLPGPCTASWDGDDLAVPTAAAGETVVLDTSAGIGTPQGLPCRLGAARWAGDGRALSITLADPDAPDPASDDPATDDPWADDPWADDPGTAADPAADDPWVDDPWADDTTEPDPAADPTIDDPADPTGRGYDVRLRVERLRSNAPATRLSLGKAPDGSAVRIDTGTRLPREVTVRLGADRVLDVTLARGLAGVRLTALSLTPVP